MKIDAVIVDTMTDGALPIDCDAILQGENIIFNFPALDSEIMIPVDGIALVLADDLHG